jgi:hypothetical protein
MAYKSRVTNQYMGATFAGQVESSNRSDVTELVNILQKEVNPALAQIADKYVETKKDVAKEKINQLLLTKDSATVQKEILAGAHPELSNAYVGKVVAQETGKAEAAATIAKIEENKSTYDFRENNLPAFYKQYLPDFRDKDGAYALGFASVFNQYKAKDAINDAQMRSKYAEEQKINNGVKILSASDTRDVWSTANSLKVALPPEEGQSQTRYLYTNEEINKTVIAHAKELLDTATSTEDTDRAIKILSMDRGLGTDGTKLGSLADTKREDVSQLIGQLNRKRVTLENQERISKDYKDKEETKKIFSDAFSDNPDGTPKTFEQKQELRKQLETKGQPSLLKSFDDIMNVNRFSNVNPELVDGFLVEVLTGSFDSQQTMITEFNKRGIPTSQLTTALTYYSKWETDSSKGMKPIHQSDSTYSQTITQINNAVKGNFTTSAGIFKSNGATAIFNANNYMIKEINEFETNFRAEKNRKPTTIERQEFIQKLGNWVINTYKDDQVNPKILSMTEKEQADFAANEATLQRQAESAANVSLISQNISNLQSLEKPQLPVFGEQDKSIFSSEKAEVNQFRKNKLIPAITEAIAPYLDVSNLSGALNLMSNDQYEQMVNQLSTFLNVNPDDIKQSIAILGKQNK